MIMAPLTRRDLKTRPHSGQSLNTLLLVSRCQLTLASCDSENDIDLIYKGECGSYRSGGWFLLMKITLPTGIMATLVLTCLLVCWCRKGPGTFSFLSPVCMNRGTCKIIISLVCWGRKGTGMSEYEWS